MARKIATQDSLPGRFQDNRAAAPGRAEHLLVIGGDLQGQVDRVLVEGGGPEPVRPRHVAQQVINEVALVRPDPVDENAGNAGVTDDVFQAEVLQADGDTKGQDQITCRGEHFWRAPHRRGCAAGGGVRQVAHRDRSSCLPTLPFRAWLRPCHSPMYDASLLGWEPTGTSGSGSAARLRLVPPFDRWLH